MITDIRLLERMLDIQKRSSEKGNFVEEDPTLPNASEMSNAIPCALQWISKDGL